LKAVRFHDYGDPDVLRYEDVEAPVPRPDEVRIRVAAMAFNPVDAGIRGGYLREPFPVPLPHVPGYDVAGTVDAVGANVKSRRVGDRVIGFLPMVSAGAAAEYALAPAQILADVCAVVTEARHVHGFSEMELAGLEPATSWVRSKLARGDLRVRGEN
jgi:NADPH:quinone reductase-like Zn-dependent oxidoreductase